VGYASLSNGRKTSPKGSHKSRTNYVADFETTTDPIDCRVWAWGFAPVDIKDNEDIEHGNTMHSFIVRVAEFNNTVYFHNLKFDGWFIIDYLLKNGFTHLVTDQRETRPGTFTTLISDMGQFYNITVRWRNGHSTEFRDSRKKIPMSVAAMAKAFDLPMRKGELDYTTFRPVGHKLTENELAYLRNDVVIVAKAMNEVLLSGMTKLTVASDSMAEYKRLTTGKQFDNLFPVFSHEMDAEIRKAYRGGWTYKDKRRQGLQRSGLVLDVNSLYPFVMKDKYLPYGTPEFVEGKATPTASHPLTIFSVTFTATLKPDHLPCIQIKGSMMFGGTEYLESIPEPTTLMVTNVDWELYNDHYDIEVLAYGNGWRFHAARGMFDAYINKWSEIKANAKGGKREIAKLHLNSLYGKYASNPNVTSKIPILDDNGAVKLVRGEDELRPPVYTAVGVFITSFARDLTIRAAQQNYATFAYADTDSLHLLQDTVPETIDVHPSRLGAWKLEYHFEAAYYIRAKAYLERKAETDCEHDREDENHGAWCYYTNRVAGLPEPVSRRLTFDDLVDGKVLHGKLNPKSVPGGVILKDIPFELKL
jgi:hypothetical protein